MDMLRDALSVRDAVEAYQRSWRADGEEQVRLLELSPTEDAEFVQPNGRTLGRDAVRRRVAGLAERWPGARVEITSGIEEHHGYVRYAWSLKRSDSVVLSGFDLAELAPDGRLRRVVQFFGPMPERQTDSTASPAHGAAR